MRSCVSCKFKVITLVKALKMPHLDQGWNKWGSITNNFKIDIFKTFFLCLQLWCLYSLIYTVSMKIKFYYTNFILTVLFCFPIIFILFEIWNKRQEAFILFNKVYICFNNNIKYMFQSWLGVFPHILMDLTSPLKNSFDFS